MDSNFKVHFEATGLDQVNAKLDAYGAKLTSIREKSNGTFAVTGKVADAQNNLGNNTDRATNALNRAGKAHESYFAHIAKTTVQSAVINQLFLQFVDVAGQAIEQVDLMNNFPATMASMGQSTKEAGEAFQSLRDYVGATGANLGQAVSMVTRFTGVTNDVKAATAIYQGLNNALIAGDTTLEEQKNAAIQFGQALERGKPDMREWNTLSTVMSQQLGIVAEQMGYASASDLGESLREGEESMSKFTTELTKLSTVGPIAEQARARMGGMQFAFGVMKNTLVQGVATIINAFGRSNIVSFFTLITASIKVLVSWIIIVMNAFVSLFNLLSGFVGGPQLQKITGDVQDTAAALGDGAAGAEDLGDGLKKAADEADEVKKSLAGFDKMNVLADPNAGKKKKDDDTNGGTKFDAGQLAELGDLGNPFADMTKGLEAADFWAKILAGTLVGLATNALINKLFGVNPLKALIGGFKDAAKAALGFGDDAEKAGKKADDAGKKSGKSFGTKFGESINKGGAKVGTAVAGFLGGVAGAIGTTLATTFAPIGATIVTAITGALAAGAAAIGVSVGVFVVIIAVAIAAIIGLIYLIYTNWETISNFVKTTASTVWTFVTGVIQGFVDWLVATWNTLYGILEGPFTTIWQVISGIFIIIVALIAIALESIYKLVVGAITLVFEVLKTIAIWIFNNVISPVIGFFVGMWQKITADIKAAWDFIFANILKPIGNWINVNVITPVANFFKSLWDRISGFTMSFVSRFASIMAPIIDWIRVNIIDRISNLFSNLWNGIMSGLSWMMGGLRGLFGGIGDIFRTPLNGIIDILNRAIDGVNRLRVPSWVPGLGGMSPNLPRIPRLAKGGVVDQATLAMVGEQGKEAVVPLENNTEWIDKIASKINTGGSAPVGSDLIPVTNSDKQTAPNITINLSGVFATSEQEKRKVAEEIVKYIEKSYKAKGLKQGF